MRSHRSTGVSRCLKKKSATISCSPRKRTIAYHKGILRSNDKGTNTFRKITRERYKCLGKKTNDDCIIKTYVYKKQTISFSFHI
ncbi:hypothetical protein DYI28_12745 [Bacteroides ovatus]|uniref:Uncharacterized protein n=1 Tax=Bacteroides ovatus TaxID=28116 RepID=A0AAP9DIU8_BACOV|nr:hypothetical protein DYI28_12745 [Bacteroides ovatus]